MLVPLPLVQLGSHNGDMSGALLGGQRLESVLQELTCTRCSRRVAEAFQQPDRKVVGGPSVQGREFVVVRPAVPEDAQFAAERTDEAGVVIELESEIAQSFSDRLQLRLEVRRDVPLRGIAARMRSSSVSTVVQGRPRRLGLSLLVMIGSNRPDR